MQLNNALSRQGDTVIEPLALHNP